MPTPPADLLSAPIPDDASYEDLAAWLEQVVALLERGDLPLDGTLLAYERGVELVRRGNELLERAELKVSELSSSLARPGAAGANGLDFTARTLFGDDEPDDSEE
ncbi:MAG TPA: exodeoxyribonuclease VII small subunit [Thermomicrobiaceae bacterium]|nr:exodeoxyribonuclease VII small subunit [Thermomicrobiaceae bacterium]